MTCKICNDTGMRPGSTSLDCSCDAATERAAMERDFPGISMSRPDECWAIHLRAVNLEATRQASRIADLERQLSEASAPAVEQQPVASDGWLIDGSLVYKLDPTGSMNAFEINVTQAEGSRKSDGPRVELAKRIMAWLAAPQAADTDKVREAAKAVLREALDAAEVHPCDTNNDSARAKQLTPLMQNLYKAMHSMAAQAPVGEVPGYKLVPIEPTPEMISAYDDYGMSTRAIWDAMLAAAPLPAAPVQQEGASNA